VLLGKGLNIKNNVVFFAAIFFISFNILAKDRILVQHKRVTLRTLDLKLRNQIDVGLANRIIEYSNEEPLKSQFGGAITRNHFFDSEQDSSKVKNLYRLGGRIAVSWAVFNEHDDVIGFASLSTQNTAPVARYLVTEGFVEGYEAQGRMVELGLFIFPEFQGKGYGKEATEARLKFIFNDIGFGTALVTINNDNYKSASNILSNGFKEAGAFLSSFRWFLENKRDMSLFYLTRTAYKDRFESFTCKEALL